MIDWNIPIEPHSVSRHRVEGKPDPSIASPTISLVILAAGESTRFPGNKLLWRQHGEAMVHRTTRVALASKVDEVVLVTGHQSRLVRTAVSDLSSIHRSRLKLSHNPRYRQGMSSSVKAGLAAVSHAAEAVIFLPADMALDNPGPINALIDSFSEGRPRILVVSHEGRRGHPILFRRDLFSEIAAIREEDEGLKALVKKYSEEVRDVPVSDMSILTDIDTPSDLSGDWTAP